MEVTRFSVRLIPRLLFMPIPLEFGLLKLTISSPSTSSKTNAPSPQSFSHSHVCEVNW